MSFQVLNENIVKSGEGEPLKIRETYAINDIAYNAPGVSTTSITSFSMDDSISGNIVRLTDQVYMLSGFVDFAGVVSTTVAQQYSIILDSTALTNANIPLPKFGMYGSISFSDSSAGYDKHSYATVFTETDSLHFDCATLNLGSGSIPATFRFQILIVSQV